MTEGRKFLQDKRLWVVTIASFVVLVVFFDRSNLIAQWKIQGEIRGMEQRMDYYRRRIEADSIAKLRLNDDYYLEKFAREQYLMRRDSDVVYVVRGAGE